MRSKRPKERTSFVLKRPRKDYTNQPVEQTDARMQGVTPDGHAVAFASPVSGINQIFLMLTSAEPLQLTNDEWAQVCGRFLPDGKEVYYGGYDLRGARADEVWAVVLRQN